MKYTDKQRVVAQLVTDCKTGSRRAKKKQKGIDQCDVTFDSMWSLMENVNQWNCIATNVPFLILDKRVLVRDRKALGLNTFFIPSIDRIDNTKGYTMDNIRIVSWGWNNALNKYSDSELWEWINAINNLHNF